MGDLADDYYEDEMAEDDKGDICPTCHGTRYVTPLSKVHAKDFFCVSTAECPDCDGTGYVY